jgi:hypothetical protein
MSLAVKLSKYIINKDNYPDLPRSLDGEILLEITPYGILSISVDNLTKILNMRDNSSLRPNKIIKEGKYKGRNMQELKKR